MLLICICLIVIFYLLHSNKKRIAEFRDEKTSYLEKIEKQRKRINGVERERDEARAKASAYGKEVADLRVQLNDTKRELEFYKNIEEDSGSLNVRYEEEQHPQIEKLSQEDASSNSAPAQNSKVLDDEQAYICKEMEWGNGNFFVTGKAGTGKSFLLEFFRKTSAKTNIVLAPTGIAALNVKGATIHSTFGYHNLENLSIDQITENKIQLKSEKRLILKKVKTIIIDEISMVRADVFDKIDRILRVINENDRPFGGKQMLLFGDMFQLPPVAKKGIIEFLTLRYGGIHFFCSDAYREGNFRFLELTNNHRQKEDAAYFSMLNRIRVGSSTAQDIQTLNSRVIYDESIFDRYTTLLPTKAEVEKLNRYHIDQLDSQGFTYQAEIEYSKNPNQNQNLESILPIASSLYLKKGVLVMMVVNDPEHRWVNGTLGIVSKLSTKGISVAINKQTYDIHPTLFTEQEVTHNDGKITYEDVLRVRQYPLVPAYAITIHKSQGQTYQNIICDIDRCFANGQAYVALSRCASLNGLHLKKRISSTSILVDRTVLDFYHHHLSSN